MARRRPAWTKRRASPRRRRTPIPKSQFRWRQISRPISLTPMPPWMFRPNYGITVTVHLIILRAIDRCSGQSFRPALAWLEGAFGQSLDATEKAVVAKRPADAF